MYTSKQFIEQLNINNYLANRVCAASRLGIFFDAQPSFEKINNNLNYKLIKDFNKEFDLEVVELKILMDKNTLILKINDDLMYSFINETVIHYNLLSTSQYKNNNILNDTSIVSNKAKNSSAKKSSIYIDDKYTSKFIFNVMDQKDPLYDEVYYIGIIGTYNEAKNYIYECIRKEVENIIQNNFKYKQSVICKNTSLQKLSNFLYEYNVFLRLLKKHVNEDISNIVIEESLYDTIKLISDKNLTTPNSLLIFIEKNTNIELTNIKSRA